MLAGDQSQGVYKIYKMYTLGIHWFSYFIVKILLRYLVKSKGRKLYKYFHNEINMIADLGNIFCILRFSPILNVLERNKL